MMRYIKFYFTSLVGSLSSNLSGKDAITFALIGVENYFCLDGVRTRMCAGFVQSHQLDGSGLLCSLQ